MKRVVQFIVFFLLVPVIPVNAAESFSVSPSSLEMSLIHATQQLVVSNTSNSLQKYSYSFEPFTLSSEGKVQFTKTDSEYKRLFSQTTVTPSTIEIQPGKSVKVGITLTAKNLPKKDYYFAILIGPTPESTAADVTVSEIAPKAAVPILYSASRKVQTALYIKSFDLPTLVFSVPLAASLTLKNNGDSYERASGTISVKNLAGKTVEQIDLPQQYILSGGERNLRASGNDTILIKRTRWGIYRIIANIQTGDTSFVKSKMILAVSPLFITLLVIVSLIISGIYLRVRRYR
jgi:hypothetical protein